MASVTAYLLDKAIRAVCHSPLTNSAGFSDSAGKMTKEYTSKYKPSKGFTMLRHNCGEAEYEELINEKCKTEKVLFHLHGGSFKVGLIDMYRWFAEKYSKIFDGARVISVDYRLFPEFEHPTQIEDAVEVYLNLINTGILPENIIFLGDSAGANLALTTALWLRDNGHQLPGSILCFSLWGDATSCGESKELNAYNDPIFGIAKSQRIIDNIDKLHRISAYAENLDRTSPYVSPCFARFEGFPPVTLICGKNEVDLSDSETVYETMKADGVDVEIYRFEGMFHDFQLLTFLVESKVAFKLAADRAGFNQANGGAENAGTENEKLVSSQNTSPNCK